MKYFLSILLAFCVWDIQASSFLYAKRFDGEKGIIEVTALDVTEIFARDVHVGREDTNPHYATEAR